MQTTIVRRSGRSRLGVALTILAGASMTLAALQAASAVRPFHAVFDNIKTEVAPVDSCTLSNLETGSGTALHLGLVRWVSPETVRFTVCDAAGPRSPAITVDGSFTLTAANGDEIHGTYTTTGTLDLTARVVSVSGTYTFDSGTGRFAKVSGGGVIAAYAADLTSASGWMDGAIKT